MPGKVKAMSDYVDNNCNGIPDAFENRRPVSEILNDESKPLQDTVILEMEIARRPPHPGRTRVHRWITSIGGSAVLPRN